MAERDPSRSADGAGRFAVPSPRYTDRDDGWTLAAELLTATFVWGGVGWLVDRWLGTGPVVMVLGFVLGNALGVYLIWLRSQDRFTQQHTELLARRARTRGPQRPATPAGSGAPAGQAPAPDGARPLATPASVDVTDPSSGRSGPADGSDPNAVDLDDDVPVTPLYPGQRHD